MNVIHGITNMEMWFGLGALVVTVIVGAVLAPAVREALNENPDDTRHGGEGGSGAGAGAGEK